MTFSSFDFIFVFLPVFILIYYVVPARLRGMALLVGSAAFYFYGVRTAPFCMLLLLALVVITYFTGVALEREPDGTLLGVVQILLFGTLLFFKYNGFFLASPLALPLGISFYTFSMSGYLWDVYRKKTGAERSFVRYASCVLLFPKLISGPITPYRTMAGDLGALETVESRLRFSRVDEGLRTFLYGLALKVLLANRLSGLWNEAKAIGYDSLTVPMAWLCLLAFSLRLYFDFWGYSLMAMGLGEMLGFSIPVNFNHPYAAKTMTDFWRRWHITLSAWFRDYLYIPLGGSRCSRGRMLFNLFAVWLATGIWHGATANFLLWAGFLYVVIVLEKLVWGKFLEKTRVLGHLVMIPLILVSWLLFAVTDMDSLFVYLRQIFGMGGPAMNPADALMALRKYGAYLAAGLLFSVPAVHQCWEKKIKDTSLGTLLLLTSFVFCVYALSMGQNDPFLYAGF